MHIKDIVEHTAEKVLLPLEQVEMQNSFIRANKAAEMRKANHNQQSNCGQSSQRSKPSKSKIN